MTGIGASPNLTAMLFSSSRKDHDRSCHSTSSVALMPALLTAATFLPIDLNRQNATGSGRHQQPRDRYLELAPKHWLTTRANGSYKQTSTPPPNSFQVD